MVLYVVVLFFIDKLQENLKHFVHHMILYYDENSKKDDVYTITTRKLLLPHINSFLQLMEESEDRKKVGNTKYAIRFQLVHCCYYNSAHNCPFDTLYATLQQSFAK